MSGGSSSSSGPLVGNSFDISGTWFTIDHQGFIKYTQLGVSVYKPLFAKAGISIDDITTPEQHRAALKKVVAAKLKK